MDGLPDDLEVPAGRDRLGRAHQLRVDISITISLVPQWIKRALIDKNPDRARGARAELVERVACAIERRFRVGWKGSDDEGDNAHPPQPFSRLFGDGEIATGIDSSYSEEEHKENK
jgi:hypothetical protein